MTLRDVKTGAWAAVREIRGGLVLRRRLGDIGLHPGDKVEVLRCGALGGPMLVRIHGARVAIGQGQAQRIEVDPVEPQ
jgi:Fe2+ transport system protein FeoA